jgi:N-acetylmuramoyl-L-alanine amidase CwlA
MNINKKLKRIDNNTFKTKINIDTYAIAIKMKRFEKAEKTQNARQELVVKTKQQKILTKFKRKKTLMMKINNEKKKSVYTTFIYQESHAKIDHNEEKKEKCAFNATII